MKRMDEEIFQKVMMAALIVLFVMTLLTFRTISAGVMEVRNGLQCNQVVDMIYEQCQEEEAIQIGTIKGHNTTLSYDHGVCIIK